MNIILIGARASGKTTVGGHIARMLRKPIVDLDGRVLANLGYDSIKQAWEKLGEPAWRAAEDQAIEHVLREDGQVIALGGGTPMIPRARAELDTARKEKEAIVIWLSCPVSILNGRLEHAPGDRPDLTSAGIHAETAAVLAHREPVYRELADLIVDSSRQGPEETARIIIEKVRSLRPEA